MILHDLDAERGLIGAFMLHPERIADAVRAGLAPCSFAAPGHAVTFAAMVKLGADQILARPFSALVDDLRRTGDLAVAGGAVALVDHLLTALPPDLLVPAWNRLRTLAVARRAMRALREAAVRVERDPMSAPDVLGLLGVTP